MTDAVLRAPPVVAPPPGLVDHHQRPPTAGPAVAAVLARALRPRKTITVSQWADRNRKLSSKGSAEPGDWDTRRNPLQREPMDCFTAGSPVREAVLMWPIQFGKSEVESNILGYTMCESPQPIMVCLPGEVSQQKFVAQKLTPLIDSTEAVRSVLVSIASRDSANTRTFKDFAGGQLYIEHAGSPTRLKSTSVCLLLVDELDQVAGALITGDDPLQMLEGRTSAFPATSKRLFLGTPEIKGLSRIEYKWERSDQRRYHVPCPHCAHEQPLRWGALNWSAHRHPEHGRQVWLTCEECGASIDERHKTAMVNAGRWVAGNPGARIRGYHANGLYYPVGLGPSWADLVEEWLDAQGDPARLKTFINDRLAEPWADASARQVQPNIVAERAEAYPLRTAPHGVLRITAGIDTQDNRLAVQLVGWGRRMSAWALDYVELPGDPALEDVWRALDELLNRPVQHANGCLLHVEASAIDIAGHRTEHVKAWVRGRQVRRPMAVQGAVATSAPVLGKGKPHDVTWRGQTDKRGILLYQVGTIAAKHYLYSRLATDADAKATWLAQPDGDGKPDAPEYACHFTEALPDGYFPGLISEVFNPSRNRFEKRRGSVRNEPLDTWVYAYAAAHHPELRLHRYTSADWDAAEAQVAGRAVLAPAGSTPMPAPAAVPTALQPAANAAPAMFSFGGGRMF